jgi:drug/metabolite transporter (DMT)-like permease
VKAYERMEVSRLAPLRYFELVISFVFAVVLFQELLTQEIIIGAAIIVISTLFLSFSESKKQEFIIQNPLER